MILQKTDFAGKKREEVDVFPPWCLMSKTSRLIPWPEIGAL
jgi:hypothetical protein